MKHLVLISSIVLMLFSSVRVVIAQGCPEAEALLRNGVFAQTKIKNESEFRSLVWELITSDETTYNSSTSGSSGGGGISYKGIGISGSGSNSRSSVDYMRKLHQSDKLNSIEDISSNELFYSFADSNLLEAYTKTVSLCKSSNSYGIKLLFEPNNGSQLDYTVKLNWDKPEGTNLDSITIKEFQIKNIKDPSVLTDFRENRLLNSTIRSFQIRRQVSWEPITYRIVTDQGEVAGFIAGLGSAPDESAEFERFVLNYAVDANRLLAATEGVFKEKIAVIIRRPFPNPDYSLYRLVRSDDKDKKMSDWELISESLTETVFYDNNVAPGKKYYYAFNVAVPNDIGKNFYTAQVEGRCKDAVATAK